MEPLMTTTLWVVTLQSLFASENTKVLGDGVPGARLTGSRARGSILASLPQGLDCLLTH